MFGELFIPTEQIFEFKDASEELGQLSQASRKWGSHPAKNPRNRLFEKQQTAGRKANRTRKDMACFRLVRRMPAQRAFHSVVVDSVVVDEGSTVENAV
jgi:hypothetical protein